MLLTIFLYLHFPAYGRQNKFNYDNHALQDLPAMIGKIQNITNYDQILYVGYSEGTSSMFELLSLKPKVSEIISAYVALAPFAFGDDVSSPVPRSLANIPGFVKTFLYINLPIFTNNLIYKTVLPTLCRLFAGEVCEQGIYFLTGYSKNQTNSTRLPVYFNNLPAGSSIPSLARFAQTIINNGKSEMLDYMSETKNIKCYNSSNPLKIPLEDIKLETIYLIYGLTDSLATPKNVEKIKASLTVPFHYRPVDVKEFGHADFMFSQNIDKLVNDDVINVLNTHIPSKTKNGLRFRQYNAETCNIPEIDTYCHISDVNLVLNNIF